MKEKTMYRAAYFCAKCEGELSFDEVMDHHGVCPRCGHTTDGTVCDHVKRAVACERRPGIVIIGEEEVGASPPPLWPPLLLLVILIVTVLAVASW